VIYLRIVINYKHIKIALCELCIVFGLMSVASFNAKASAEYYTSSDGVGLVYSSISKVSWVQDGNLLGTMIKNLGYDNVVNAIIYVGPNKENLTISDTPNAFDTPPGSGVHTVTTADFEKANPGVTTWYGAKAFVDYLNRQNYGGSNQWRLPTVGSKPATGRKQTFENDMGQLYYLELNRISDNQGAAFGVTGKGCWGNCSGSVGGLVNVQNLGYWMDKETKEGSFSYAWYFYNTNGTQAVSGKKYPGFVWPVVSGQIK
jgi:hypothetical protein